MNNGWDIFKIYRLIRKKNQYPHLLGLMNLTFMEILEQRGIISREALHEKALGQLKSDGLLVESIMGLLPVHSGEITFLGQDITGLNSRKIPRLGIGYVPEGRRIYPDFTANENILLAV